MQERKMQRLTSRVSLPGGQDRLRQAILYVAQKCASSDRFGSTKLNKILWRADFASFAKRGVPVTGRDYQRLPLGPALREMVPLHREMVDRGLIRLEPVDFGDGIIEQRTVPLREPNLSDFDTDDIAFLDSSIAYYWNKTGRETSDDSHGVAWKTRNDRDPMPYELSYLSDIEIRPRQKARILDMARRLGWRSH